MTNEKEFIEYVKSKVKFEGEDCTHGSIRVRCTQCKKYFND
jgi:hypothetical protein